MNEPVLAGGRWPDLPVAIKSGVSARIDGSLFVGLGSGGAHFLRLDLGDLASGWVALAPFPGPATSGAACAAVGGRIYVFGGAGTAPDGDATIFEAVYAYDISSDRWSLLDTRTPCGMLGARAAALSDGRIVVVGGYAKDVFDGFVATMAAIDKERHPEQADAARRAFLGREPAAYGWNGDVLCYDPVANSWGNLGKSPFLPNCDAAMIARGGDVFMLVNGEVKPGLRTAEVKSLGIAGNAVTWSPLPELSAPGGDACQEGLAGAFGGEAGGIVLVAGGANFKGSQANARAGKWFTHDGLGKQWREEVYAFDGSHWAEVGKLPRGLGYGASFTLSEGLLVVGGEDGEGRARQEVFLIRRDGAGIAIID